MPSPALGGGDWFAVIRNSAPVCGGNISLITAGTSAMNATSATPHRTNATSANPGPDVTLSIIVKKSLYERAPAPSAVNSGTMGEIVVVVGSMFFDTPSTAAHMTNVTTSTIDADAPSVVRAVQATAAARRRSPVPATVPDTATSPSTVAIAPNKYSAYQIATITAVSISKRCTVRGNIDAERCGMMNTTIVSAAMA